MSSVALGRTGSALPRSSWPQRLFEFLLVGGATPLLFPLSWWLQESLGLNEAELLVGATMFYAAHALNDPHFSVTYLLFYRDARERAFGRAFDRPQRARYLMAGFVAPVLLMTWVVGAISLGSAPALGLLVQLMFLLVGWHYVKQGFGVLSVLSARRGVRFSSRERKALLSHCYAGWAYAWTNPAVPARWTTEKGVRYEAFARPELLEHIALVLVIGTGVWACIEVARKIRREGRLPILTPLVGMLVSVWAWLVWSNADPLVRYVVPALHAVQYLFFVRLLAKNEAEVREGPPHFEPSARSRVTMLAVTALLLGFVLFDGLPLVFDGTLVPRGGFEDAADLGVTPWFAGLNAFVNVHHYCMDAVIWRRDNPLTRYLFRA